MLKVCLNPSKLDLRFDQSELSISRKNLISLNPSKLDLRFDRFNWERHSKYVAVLILQNWTCGSISDHLFLAH